MNGIVGFLKCDDNIVLVEMALLPGRCAQMYLGDKRCEVSATLSHGVAKENIGL